MVLEVEISCLLIKMVITTYVASKLSERFISWSDKIAIGNIENQN